MTRNVLKKCNVLWCMRNSLSAHLGLTLAAFALATASAVAAPITVANASFETLPGGGLPFGGCGTGCAYSDDAIPDWINSPGSGQFHPGTPANTLYFDTLSDGPHHAYSNGPTIFQTVGPTVQPGFLYTLQVDIGDRKDTAGAGAAFLVVNGIDYAAIGTLVGGAFATFTATYLGSIADNGLPITIELRSSGAQGNFDDVRLAAAAVPEPASVGLLGLGLAGLAGARRLRRSSKA